MNANLDKQSGPSPSRRCVHTRKGGRHVLRCFLPRLCTASLIPVMLLRTRRDAWLMRHFLFAAFGAPAAAARCARCPPWSSAFGALCVSCAFKLCSILLKMPSSIEFRLGPRARTFKSSRFLAFRGGSSPPKASRAGLTCEGARRLTDKTDVSLCPKAEDFLDRVLRSVDFLLVPMYSDRSCSSSPKRRVARSSPDLASSRSGAPPLQRSPYLPMAQVVLPLGSFRLLLPLVKVALLDTDGAQECPEPPRLL